MQPTTLPTIPSWWELHSRIYRQTDLDTLLFRLGGIHLEADFGENLLASPGMGGTVNIISQQHSLTKRSKPSPEVSRKTLHGEILDEFPILGGLLCEAGNRSTLCPDPKSEPNSKKFG